jgi:hypothetical protein
MTPRVLRLMDTFITAFTHRRRYFITAVFNYYFFLNFEFPPLKDETVPLRFTFFISFSFIFLQKILSEKNLPSLRFSVLSFRWFPLKRGSVTHFLFFLFQEHLSLVSFMDPSQRAFLFNQMMQALELGDKEVADKIESYLRNFNPTSPVPIPLYTSFNSESDAPDFVFLSTSDSDSSDMAKTPRTAGSGRRGPRTPRDSLLGAQTVIDSDVEDHRRDNLCFAADRPSSFDTEVNVVGEQELGKYKRRYDIPIRLSLFLRASGLHGIRRAAPSPSMGRCSAVG